MDYYSQLCESLKKISEYYDFDKIKKAYEYAYEMHKGQFRKSGEEYISHPVAVAIIVAQLELDTDSVCAALLHDTLEDCKDKTNIETIRKIFGKEICDLVDGVTKFTDIHFEDRDLESIENLRKMFLAMSKDIRVIFIKLADRLHNLRTLSAQPQNKQRSIALETMHVYASIAHRLGIQKIKGELENLSLMYLDPIGYEEVKKDIEHRYGQNRSFLDNAQEQVSKKLNEEGIKFSMTGRVKSIYSIYKKMYNQGKSFEEIYDFYAIRIIVDSELECYTVLGIIHEMFNLLPGRFKDYISTPKPNMYRSLHTTVIGKHGIPFEVQIRTWEMHTIAEYGIAAHWKYKSGDSDKENIAEKLKWIRTLIETDRGEGDADEFLRPLKIDIFEDEIFVFTPKGDVINLPNGSTPIDFAYAIHTEVGNRFVGAKLNGMMVPKDTVLQTGQIVEVITSPTPKGPSKDWLGIVRTSEAKNKIRQWFKKECRDENIIDGKNVIEKEFKNLGHTFSEQEKNEIINNVSKRFGMDDTDDFYNSVGFGGISISKIAPKLKDESERILKTNVTASPENIIRTEESTVRPRPKRGVKTSAGVIVDGIENCQVRFAKCCNPLPGDNIIGFVTRGFGVSVHKVDCPNVTIGKSKSGDYKDRWVNVHWIPEKSSSDGEFETILKIYAKNSINVISNITSVVGEMKIQLNAMNSKVIPAKNIILITLNLTCRNTEHVNLISSRIKNIEDIYEVTRGFS